MLKSEEVGRAILARDPNHEYHSAAVQQCSGAAVHAGAQLSMILLLLRYEEEGKPGTHNSFPTVMLVEATLQWEEDDGSIDIFDRCICQCELLDHALPAIAKVFYGYKNASLKSLVHLPCCWLHPWQVHASLAGNFKIDVAQ